MEAHADAIDSTAEEIGVAEDKEGGPVAPGNEMVPAGQQADQVTLFRTNDPVEVLERAGAAATALKRALVTQGMTSRIQGRDHVNVEGWQTVGAMLGVYPVKEWVRELPWPDDLTDALAKQKAMGRVYGYEASYRAQRADGAVVGSGEGTCSRGETKPWLDRSDNALRSMAQTRATSRALKSPLGFVVTMAGYTATPAEEMPDPAADTPAFGPEASAELRATAMRALEYLLNVGDDDLDPHREATGMLAALNADAGYLPRVVLRAVVQLAAHVRSLDPAAQDAADTPAADDAADTDPPAADAADDTAVLGGQEGAEQE